MSLIDLERAGRLWGHEASQQEVADLMRLADAGLADARVEAVSLDRRFCAAYDAARSLAALVLACTGYRPVGQGRHVTVFEALPLVLGESYVKLGAYFNTCRVKRNVAEYERPGQIMPREVMELIGNVEAFRADVRAWLHRSHRELQPPTK